MVAVADLETVTASPDMSADQFKGLLKLSEHSRQALVKKSRIHDVYDVEHSPFAR